MGERSVLVALRTAQSLLGLEGGVTGLDVTVADVWAAEIVARAIEGTAGVRTESWIHSSIQFFTAVDAQQVANTLIRAFSPSVALGVASVLVASVVQRSRHRTRGTTFLVTHGPRLASRCDRIIEVVDGRIVADAPALATTPA